MSTKIEITSSHPANQGIKLLIVINPSITLHWFYNDHPITFSSGPKDFIIEIESLLQMFGRIDYLSVSPSLTFEQLYPLIYQIPVPREIKFIRYINCMCQPNRPLTKIDMFELNNVQEIFEKIGSRELTNVGLPYYRYSGTFKMVVENVDEFPQIVYEKPCSCLKSQQLSEVIHYYYISFKRNDVNEKSGEIIPEVPLKWYNWGFWSKPDSRSKTLC